MSEKLECGECCCEYPEPCEREGCGGWRHVVDLDEWYSEATSDCWWEHFTRCDRCGDGAGSEKDLEGHTLSRAKEEATAAEA